MRPGALLLLSLVLTSCAAQLPSEKRWSTPTATFFDTWQARSDSTYNTGYLAAVDLESQQRTESFTLEMFYRRPDTYILRGRGALGATGFRAKLVGDSLTLLLNRENRGYAGRVRDYPDSSLVEMWQLMARALPWIFGNAPLHGSNPWRARLTNRGTRPEYIEIYEPPYRLGLQYGRYRSEYPYWHLKSVMGIAEKTLTSTEGECRLALTFRQWLYNTSLPPNTFELSLPPGTHPLND